MPVGSIGSHARWPRARAAVSRSGEGLAVSRQQGLLQLFAFLVVAGSLPLRGEPPVVEAKPRPVLADTPVRTDRHGDPLPAAAIARFGTVRLRVAEAEYIVCAAVSPDGKLIASGDGVSGDLRGRRGPREEP